MRIYAIGDVQGCYQELIQLLDHIQFDTQQDQLWFTGDLVNRGHQSLEVLRFVKGLGTQAISVLGNHDLHYLAVAAGVTSLEKEDTFEDILQAEDSQDLFDWMRHRPLIYSKNDFLLVHAGIAPMWDKATALACAQEVETALQGPHYLQFLKNLYGNFPSRWDPALKNDERFRIIVNYCTRMRYVDKKGNLELCYKGKIGGQPEGYVPWFKAPSHLSPYLKVVFGHWATLGGKTDTPNRFALDTGCCWGNALTALRLEDLQYFSIKCHYLGASK